MDKVPNEELLHAGLAAMKAAGRPLERIQSGGRSMIYRMEDGSTVRVRTCNDHVLVVLANDTKADAKLNIEGTNYLLIVMPLIPRTRGKIVAYLVPSAAAADAARAAHSIWLKGNPSTNGNNRTWNVWFDGDESQPWMGFASKWKQFVISTKNVGSEESPTQASSLGEVIANAKKRIAAVAGVPEAAIRISIDLG